MKKAKRILVFLFSSIGVCLPILFVMTSCAPVNQADVVGSLFPNLYVFLAHIFASIVLISCCIWLVWKPTKFSFEKRKEYILNEIKKAEEARKDAILKLEEAEKQKIDAFAQAKIIIDSAENQAYSSKEQIEYQAKLSANKIISAANDEIIKLKNNIQQNMNKQIVDIALDVSETLLKKNYSSEDNKKIVDDFINELSNKESNKR